AASSRITVDLPVPDIPVRSTFTIDPQSCMASCPADFALSSLPCGAESLRSDTEGTEIRRAKEGTRGGNPGVRADRWSSPPLPPCLSVPPCPPCHSGPTLSAPQLPPRGRRAVKDARRD